MTRGGALFPVYVALATIGTVAPLAKFLPWLYEHGVDPRAFVADLFANGISAFFGWDVIVSALVLIVFIAVEGRRAGIRRRWIAVVATVVVGVSSGLPIFLAMRERFRR